MLSMSAGRRKFSALVVRMALSLPLMLPLGVDCELFTSSGTPSITYSGWVLPENEFTPRIWMLRPEPGAPSFWVTCTPATLPCRPRSMDNGLPIISSSRLSEATEPVRSLFFTEP